MTQIIDSTQAADIAERIRSWARQLGFQQVGISDIDLSEHEAYLQKWLEAGYHGDMQWMASHGSKRSHPEELVPGTCRVLSVRMDYLPEGADPERILASPDRAYISRYTLGRDYHKLLRKRLAQLAKRIADEAGGGRYRAFVDSAPVLERALAERAGLGWIAKNTMLINERVGSWFFLGEIYTDLPLPADDARTSKHCGSCRACLDICPTDAFVGPFQLDARRCISYLTIEHKGSIDPALRPLMGNRIFGCDDCQLVCPWNKFAQHTTKPTSRHATGSTIATWSRCSCGTRTPIRRAPRGRRCAASATNAGCAISPSRWAMRQAARRLSMP